MVTRVRWTPPEVPFTAAEVPVDGQHLARLARRGALTRLLHGVYVASHAVPEDPRRQHLLVALAYQTKLPHLVASHETAALALGLPRLPNASQNLNQQTLTFTSAGGLERSRNTSRLRVHLGALPPHAVTSAGQAGFPDLRITTRSRTAVDIAVGEGLAEALVVLDAATRQAALEQSGSRALRGSVAAKTLDTYRRPLRTAAQTRQFRAPHKLQRYIAATDPRRESVPESLSAGHILAAGLPRPVPQGAITVESRTWFPDFVWPEHRVVGEVDGLIKYAADPTGSSTASTALAAEKVRQEALETAGWRVLRWGYHDIVDRPEHVIGRLVQALSTASASRM